MAKVTKIKPGGLSTKDIIAFFAFCSAASFKDFASPIASSYKDFAILSILILDVFEANIVLDLQVLSS